MSTQAPARPLTMALSKGRIFEETLPLLAAAGVQVSEDPEKSRKLIIETSNPNLRLIIVRASDVPTYVEYGAADLGIAGKDVLIEHAASHPGGLYQPIDLNIARCRLARQPLAHYPAGHIADQKRYCTILHQRTERVGARLLSAGHLQIDILAGQKA